jgi:hypothetical protein
MQDTSSFRISKTKMRTRSLVLVFALSFAHGDFCDDHLGSDFCLLKDKIPCHDMSCQLHAPPGFKCEKTDTVAVCAARALPACTALADCVAFAVYNHPGPRFPWVEWYNSTATASPLDSSDWDYYFNSTALGPAPKPAPTCVPGPSTCKPAPPGSIFPPPGDYPPGCNHKGCTTLPTLLPKWKPTYVMNESTLIMPCNNTGE